MIEARGEILTVPTDKGDIRNLTRTPAVAERDPAWSPGRQVDRLLLRRLGRVRPGRSATRAVSARSGRSPWGIPRRSSTRPSGPPTARRSPTRTSGTTSGTWTWRRARPSRWTPTPTTGPEFNTSWSPDGKWLAYTKQLPNHFHAVFVYSLEQGRSYPDHRRDERRPLPGLRRERQVPLLHRQHRLRAFRGRPRHVQQQPPGHAQRLRRRASKGPPLPSRARRATRRSRRRRRRAARGRSGARGSDREGRRDAEGEGRGEAARGGEDRLRGDLPADPLPARSRPGTTWA